MLNIAYSNIHSFSKSKFDDNVEFFSSLYHKYDVICFSETMQNSPDYLPGFATPFILNAKKTKKRGRKSGGLMIFVKKEIYKYFTKVKESDNSIWIKIENIKCSGYISQSIYLCFCYVKPYKSKDLSEHIFSQLTTEISYFQSLGEVLISGDFNARTGDLTDFIPHDSTTETFSDCPLPLDYSPDPTLPRSNTDNQTNLHGELLTTLCKTLNLRILNGRFMGDSLGYCTFYNFNGSSCVDYMLATNRVLHNVMYFNVLPPTELSDHSIICTRLKCIFDYPLM